MEQLKYLYAVIGKIGRYGDDVEDKIVEIK